VSHATRADGNHDGSASEWIHRLQRARAAGEPSWLLESVPYAGFLGLTFRVEGGELLGGLPFAPHLVGDSSLPALHGGTVAALLESTAWLALAWELEPASPPRSVTCTVDYLRSGRTIDTLASASITKRGKRIVTVRASAWQRSRDEPIATANAHFLIAP
jgi:acyl-coenzyme A thioesterase PaaI-like protein